MEILATMSGVGKAEGGPKVSENLKRVVAFLNSIGLSCEIQPGASGFVEGIQISTGKLLVSPEARVSGLLHEAGHLAVFPGNVRHLANGRLTEAMKAIVELGRNAIPDSTLARACNQCSDPEATAWAWAAGTHLGLDPREIVQDDEYDNGGADIRLMLSMGRYMGINGLAFAGFCVTRPGPLELMSGLPAYPKLAMWLQKDITP